MRGGAHRYHATCFNDGDDAVDVAVDGYVSTPTLQRPAHRAGSPHTYADVSTHVTHSTTTTPHTLSTT